MNNELTNTVLRPTRAIVLYQTGKGYSQDFYLESREIKADKGKYVFGAPQPLDKDTLKDIAATYMKKESFQMSFDSLIPGHILYARIRPGALDVLWFRPAQLKKLNFSASLKIKGESAVWIPPTLYLVHNSSLYLFALQNNKRPELSTKLHHAPFFNIYKGGNVCLGTAPIGKMRSKTFEGEAERYERGFYLAEQNGGHNIPTKTPLEKLWSRLIKKPVPFPAKEELIQHPEHKTLSDLMTKLIGNATYKEEDTLEDN
jgi:PRTRC genetic system protein B